MFAVILAIGCWNVYFVDHGDYDCSCIVNDGSISLSVTGTDAQYRYSVYSNTRAPDDIYLYLDERYPSDLNTYYQQSDFLNVLKDMLERRGMDSTGFVDADGLKDVMTSSCTIVFVSGALPDTVYDGTGTDLFTHWMDMGGNVFWTGPEIGRYVSSPDGAKDLGKGIFNGMVCTEKDSFGYGHSDMYQYTCVRYDDCTYGLSVDVPDSLSLGYVSEDGYSAVSVAKYMNGSVTVFGGNVAVTENISQVLTDRTFFSEIVISGLTYQSVGLAHGEGMVSDKDVMIDLDVSSFTDVNLTVIVGEPASKWGRTFIL